VGLVPYSPLGRGFLIESELALLEPIAAKVVGDRYPDMTLTSAGRE
jgi:hypothetical protein